MRNTAIVCCLVAVLAAGAHASPITFGYTGHVTQTPSFDPIDPFGGAVHPVVCDPLNFFGCDVLESATVFNGTYTFDSAATDQIADPQTGSYASTGGPFGFTLSIAGVDFNYGGVSIGVGNDFPFPLGDFYSVTSLPLSSTNFLEIFMASVAGNPFLSDALPLLPPPLGQFPVADFHLGWAFDTLDENQNPIFVQVQVDGTLDSLVCTAGCSVPEPGSLALIVIGGAAVAATSRRRTRVTC